MAPLWSRFLGYSKLVQGQDHQVWEEEDALNVLNSRFYFDMAGWAFPVMDKGLLEGVGLHKTRLLYGSDYPFTRAAGVASLMATMDGEKGTKGWAEEDIENAYYLNAKRLFETSSHL